LVWTAVFLFLAGGCTAKEQQIAAVTTSPSAATAPAEGVATLPPLQSNSERNMVQLFRFLIEMDRVPKTSLSQQQAKVMLPLVRQTAKQGTMGEEEQQTILSVLGAEQKAIYAQWLKFGDGPPNKEPFPDGLPEDGLLRKKEECLGQEAAAGSAPAAGHGGEHPVDRQDYGPRQEDKDWIYEEKNVEQQLLELLESKAGI
jgi:hypothetical protein